MKKPKADISALRPWEYGSLNCTHEYRDINQSILIKLEQLLTSNDNRIHWIDFGEKTRFYNNIKLDPL